MESLLGNSRRPDIKFFRSGKIDISSSIARQLRLERGDTLDIVTHRGEYYLVVRCRSSRAIGRNEATCIPTNSSKSCSNFRAYSKTLCSAILSETGGDEARLPGGESQVIEPYGTAIPLITRNNLIKK